MKFEMIIPELPGHTSDELVERYMASVEARRRTDWPVIAELYVTYGQVRAPFELDMGKVAGKVTGKPEKGADGKWSVEVELYDSAPGKTLNTLIPYMEKEGKPFKVLLNGYYDGHIVMGPWSLYFTNDYMWQTPME